MIIEYNGPLNLGKLKSLFLMYLLIKDFKKKIMIIFEIKGKNNN